ncbi:MAG: hypothetical protein MRERC_2c131 [Mycoplasmataceae bacterium RC_NB112A]|nr:MAG: hypothetical protein MRERC_2c131 [Mycoplasmataceae bacterium RC_NB112A]
MNGRKRMKPDKRIDNRDIYVRKWIPHRDKDYLLVFWFENNNPDWIWIRNFCPIN